MCNCPIPFLNKIIFPSLNGFCNFLKNLYNHICLDYLSCLKIKSCAFKLINHISHLKPLDGNIGLYKHVNNSFPEIVHLLKFTFGASSLLYVFLKLIKKLQKESKGLSGGNMISMYFGILEIPSGLNLENEIKPTQMLNFKVEYRGSW